MRYPISLGFKTKQSVLFEYLLDAAGCLIYLRAKELVSLVPKRDDGRAATIFQSGI